MRKDIDLSFNKHPLTGDLSVKKGSSAIKQALRNIVLTNFYERGYNTEFGTDVKASLFENNIDGVTAQGIRQNIINAIENYEPQVDIIDVTVESTDQGNGLNIQIFYQELNNPVEQELTVII